MQCPNCHMDAVDAGVFCNHCGIRLPALCRYCDAENPPESRFCHQCGNSLSVTSTPTPTRETRIRDIGADLKTLGRDVAAYSAPRIKRGSIVTARSAGIVGVAAARHTRNLAVVIAPRARSLFQRLKPYRPESPPVIPASYVGDDTENQPPPAPSGPAVSCPRCHQVSEPDALFCFSCGLPLDESEPTSAYNAPAYSGQPAGFWSRLESRFGRPQ